MSWEEKKGDAGEFNLWLLGQLWMKINVSAIKC